MRYKGFIIDEQNNVYEGDKCIFEAKTLTEAKQACDEIEADIIEYSSELRGQWY